MNGFRVVVELYLFTFLKTGPNLRFEEFFLTSPPDSEPSN